MADLADIGMGKEAGGVRLTRFRVRDYRSINDSGEVAVEPSKTLLVGVNEAGKTALLKALQQVKAPAEAPIVLLKRQGRLEGASAATSTIPSR